MAKFPTEWVYLQGKGSWIKTKGLNPWGKWTCTIHPDPESLEKARELQAAGVKNVIKKDEDGYNVTYSRPFEKEFKDRAGVTRKIGFTPVVVLDRDLQPFDGLIGNGSDITVKLEVYTHGTPSGGKAKAARLASIKIDNLIPYSRDDFTNGEAKSAEGLETVKPQPLF